MCTWALDSRRPLWYPPSIRKTFYESCGVADLVASCYGGRNRRVAEAFAIHKGEKPMDELEAELLGGQRLQGVLTSQEVHHVLASRGWQADFPLFERVFAIFNEGAPLSSLTVIAEDRY